MRHRPGFVAAILQMLYETNPEFGWTAADAAPANVLNWRERVEAFEDVAAFSRFSSRATLIQQGEPRLLDVALAHGCSSRRPRLVRRHWRLDTCPRMILT